MNRQIRLVGIGIMVLFVALFLQLNYLQVVRAGSLDRNPRNGRAVVKEYDAARGDIVSADGVTLAHSTPTSDQFKYLRQYPQGPLFGQITGYFSFTYGSDGAEKTYDTTITGANAKFKLPTNVRDLRNLLVNQSSAQSITLTVSDRLQSIAAQQLRGRIGSVVALNPQTGAILAMYSNPSFDPNLLSGHSQPQVVTNYKALVAASGNPLSSGAYRNRFFPGSTFKMITAAAVYDHDPALATKAYPVSSGLQLPNTGNVLHNFGGEVCGGQLLELFTVSCNSGFGQVGLDLGAANLAAEASSFGFDKTPPLDLPAVAPSNFPPVSAFAQDLPGLAFSAIGQQDVQASPLQMALVAAAFADNGTIMTPHILDQVTDSQGQIVGTYQTKPWLQATSAATAAQMTQLMESVVARGTGVAARIPGVTVAGKTGTAQSGNNTINAWFAAFAPNPNPSIAVAVLLPGQPSENEIQGGTVAAPIAKAIIQAYLAGGSTTPPGSGGPGTSSSTSTTVAPAKTTPTTRAP